MDEWVIEHLDRAHERRDFTCGKAPLDDFLRTLVSQYEKRDLGRTYVAIRQGDKRVFGYYTLAAGSVSFQNVPSRAAKKLPKHPVPVILLARLAVDQTVRGQGLGRVLLLDALTRSLELSANLGIHAVEVDAIDEEARQYYHKYGFVALEDSPLHMYLSIASIGAALTPQKTKKDK